MTIEENKKIVTRFNKEVIEGKRVELMDELFLPEFINRSARPGFSPGPDGMIHFLSNVLWQAFSELEVEIHVQIAEGDKVSTRKTIHGKHTGPFMGLEPSGKKIELKIIDIVRLKDGKDIEHWSAFDLQQVLAQIKE